MEKKTVNRLQRGSIAKKKEIYYVVLNLQDAAGQRSRKWIRVGPDWKEAQQRLTAELAALDNGVSTVNTGRESLGHLLTRWLDTMEGSLTPRTIEGYRTIIKRIIPVIGNLQLRKVGPADIQGYFSTMLSKKGRFDGKGALSPLTVGHHRRLLHKVFEDAVNWGLIPRNPADRVKAPKAKSKGHAIMDEHEINLFLNAASEDYFPLFHTFLYTGARRSEILALKWSDFDPQYCTLSISRSLHRLHDGEFVTQSTKSTASKRTIDLDDITVDVLQKQREHMFLLQLELGTMLKSNDLIFSQYDGSPLLPDSISKAWSKLAKKLGIAASNLHAARHTHASILLKLGIDYKTIQARLGHSTAMVTLDIYSHVTPGVQKEAAKRFSEALQGVTIERG